MTQLGKAYSSSTCPFRLSVINDELTPDFGRACEIAAGDFGLQWIELRAMWNKNITELDAKEIAEACRLLKKYQAPYRAAINDKLRSAAQTCARSNLILLLENEMSCNTATGEEAAAVLKAIPDKNLMLNWDPGNAAALGSTPYPDGYRLLPIQRIGHCHAKDVVRPAGKKYEWAPVGGGVVDWVGQLRAMAKDGYHYAVSLETHWRGAGTPEASSRISMKGLKDSLAKAGLHC